MWAGSGWRNPHRLTHILCLKCTDLLMDPAHYIIGVDRTQMMKINHRGGARVNYISALPNSTISFGKKQKLLLALGSNMREWCLGEEWQWRDCQWKHWKILDIWCWAWKRGGRKSRRFSRREKYLRTGIWKMHMLHTHARKKVMVETLQSKLKYLVST